MDIKNQPCMDALLQNIKTKDEKLLESANYGNLLLETIQKLEAILEKTNFEYEKKIEEFEQQKYTLETKLESLKKSEEQLKTAWSDEKCALVAAHKNEIDLLQKQLKCTSDQFNFKVFDMQKEIDEHLLVKNQLSEKIQRQNDTIAELRTALEKPSVESDSLPSEVTELSALNEKLQSDCNFLTSECDVMKDFIEQLQFQIKDHERKIEFFRDTKENAEKEIQSLADALEECQIRNQDIQHELDEIHAQPQDPQSRGNSLFAEVEDRRVQAEKKAISLQVKLKCMENKYSQQVNYAITLKSQIAQLLHSGGREADRERIARLELALVSSQKDSQDLSEKVAELESKLATKMSNNMKNLKEQSKENDNFVTFLEDLLKTKDIEIKKLYEDLRKSQMDSLTESRRANEADEDVYKAQAERDKMKAQCLKLKIEVDRLKLKCGEDVRGKRNVRPGNVEKINLKAPLEPSQENFTNINVENIPSGVQSKNAGFGLEKEKNSDNSFSKTDKLNTPLNETAQKCTQQ